MRYRWDKYFPHLTSIITVNYKGDQESICLAGRGLLGALWKNLRGEQHSEDGKESKSIPREKRTGP